ncbi:unnamed protein product [Rhodiola kirilowii]
MQVGSIEIKRICNAVDYRILESVAFGVPPSGGGPEQLVIAVVFTNSKDKNPDLNQLKNSFDAALQTPYSRFPRSWLSQLYHGRQLIKLCVGFFVNNYLNPTSKL